MNLYMILELQESKVADDLLNSVEEGALKMKLFECSNLEFLKNLFNQDSGVWIFSGDPAKPIQ